MSNLSIAAIFRGHDYGHHYKRLFCILHRLNTAELKAIAYLNAYLEAAVDAPDDVAHLIAVTSAKLAGLPIDVSRELYVHSHISCSLDFICIFTRVLQNECPSTKRHSRLLD